MPFISPMLASPTTDRHLQAMSNPVAVEEKIDGHRVVVETSRDDHGTLVIQAWSRYGNPVDLSPGINRGLENLPEGIWDGELFVPGRKAYGTKDLQYVNERRFAIFDVLELRGRSCTGLPFKERRDILESVLPAFSALILSDVEHIDTTQMPWVGCTWLRWMSPVGKDIQEALAERLRNGGEGLIIKDRLSTYASKRSKQWLKLKSVQHAVLRIVGFKTSLANSASSRGPYARVELMDSQGRRTIVKTKNNKELAKFEAEGAQCRSASLFDDGPQQVATHPAIGRLLMIEYNEMTEDEGYREPRWDRWAEPGETLT